MSIRDFNAQRLFINAALRAGEVVACDKDQTNYLKNVLRLKAGDEVLLFNGIAGEWRARLDVRGKRSVELVPQEQTRPQQGGPDLEYLFAPLKRVRLDYMVQKATELGVSKLRPVLTQHTVADRVNLARMRANVIEAAEQCGILHVPEICEPEKLERVIAGWEAARPLIFCDEGAAGAGAGPLGILRRLERGPLALLIGPEGGFSAEERDMLNAKPFVTAISLGPRIMRADTAAVAALALVNAALGDWR